MSWNQDRPYRRPYLEDSSSFLLEIETPPILTTTGHIHQPSRWASLWWFTLTFIVTFTWVTLLLCYAIFSSFSSIPLTLFQTPSQAVFALNLGSTVAIFLLCALANEASEILRWRLATQRGGIGIATFLALGRATTAVGVIRLLFSRQKVGHRKWCIQRFHTRK